MNDATTPAGKADARVPQSRPVANGGASEFVAAIARYYRDFLETDFKRAHVPTRQVRVRSRDGAVLGFNVRRFPELHTLILQLLAKPLGADARISVRRNQYKSRITGNLQTLVRAQITALPEKAFNDAINDAVVRIRKAAPQAQSQFDAYVDFAQDIIAAEILKAVIRPIIDNIRAALSHASLDAEDLVYEIEDDLREHVIAAIRENLPSALTALALQNDLKPLIRLLHDELDAGALRPYLEEFFVYLATADVYDELLAIAQVLAATESLELYLYVIDLLWRDHQFPVAYLPVRLGKLGDEFQLTLDSRLFFNRRALRYLPDHDDSHTLRVPGKPTDDRIHIVFDTPPLGILEDALIAIADAYSIAERLALGAPDLKRATAGQVSLTNAMHLCAFDRSEESIVNDYEEILVQAQTPGGALSELFESLVRSCILDEPKTVNAAVENEWTETASADRLVYESPVPLNEEQRKLLLALRKPSSKYNVVDGPPGTGKSHTITAIAFDAIQRGQSVLVLSDKQEALDVVEDKLTQTLNGIRSDDDFPNPILRLGRDHGTYGEILSRASIAQIQRYHHASKANRDILEQRISTRAQGLKTDVTRTIEALSAVPIGEIVELEKLSAKFANLEGVEASRLKEAAQMLSGLATYLDRQSMAARQEFAALCDGGPALDEVIRRTKLRWLAASTTRDCAAHLPALAQIQGARTDHIPFLESMLTELRALRRPLIGYLFRGAQLRAIAQHFTERLPLEGVRAPHQRRDELERILVVLKRVRRGQQELNLSDLDFYQATDVLRTGPVTTALDADLTAWLQRIEALCREEPQIGTASGLGVDPVAALQAWSPQHSQRVRELSRYLELEHRLGAQFAHLPELDFLKTQTELQQLHTVRLANVLDERVVQFINEKSATVASLREVIKRKQAFPRDKFADLQAAFPCMIAGIREFADYIPLAQDLFDLVIIDEASQVSIAQALPALLRAKQIVVMGDEKQFANVKTSQASIAVNSGYLRDLDAVFRKHFPADNAQLARLRQFDVRTSILRFFELIANFRIMLRKHFRGFQELISFSSKYFYGNDLQAIRVRALPIDQVIRFTHVTTEPTAGRYRNTNDAECRVIQEELERLLEREDPPTVGVITPFTEQQRLLSRELLFKSDLATDFRERLRLKIMTFDTCQGEERDVVFYSMVARAGTDRLNYIFPIDLSALPDDGDQKIKVQRLNVGFSRAKDCMHFVLSQPIEQYKGSAGQALRHYQRERELAVHLPDATEVDPNSPMEKNLLGWLLQTPFFQQHREHIEIRAQFPIGKYLRQLDPYYEHPRYRCDFLILFLGPTGKNTSIILEYDGFQEHFRSRDAVHAQNYEWYYREEDVERQHILESYGYNFIRVNRFNLGRDPVATLSERLTRLIEKRQGQKALNDISHATRATVADLESGAQRQCPKCARILKLQQFKRSDLKTGIGRLCNACAR